MQRNPRNSTKSTGYVQAALAAFFAGQRTPTDHAPTPAPLRSVGNTMQFAGNAGRKETPAERLEFANGAGSNIFPVRGYGYDKPAGK